MKETELLYYFPYKIDKENNFRYYADVGNFKGIFLEYVPHVTGRMPVTIDNQVTYDEWQEGRFWNVWLSFDKLEK